MNTPRPTESRWHTAEDVRALWGRQPGLGLGYLIDLLTAFGAGFALLLGGYARTNIPVFRILNENGGPTLWGSVFITAGISMLIVPILRTQLIFWLMLVLACLYGLFCWWFTFSAITDNTVSFLGSVWTMRAAANHVTRAVAYRLERI